MDYITVAQAAEKWGLSLRQVQRILAAGRISGGKKHGREYLIPAEAEKPLHLRSEKKEPLPKSLSAEFAYVIEVTTQPVSLGDLDMMMSSAVREEYPEWAWLYCEGVLAWLRGDYARAIQCYHRIDNDAVKLRYGAVAVASAVCTGDYPLFLAIETYNKNLIKGDMGANVTAVAEYNLAAAYIGAFADAMIPNWLKSGDFTTHPLPIRLEAVCLHTRYLTFLKKNESALDIARTALAFDRLEQGVSYPGIYLRIMCAVACCGLGRVNEGKNWLRDALELSLPHGFVTPLAELRMTLGGLLEELLLREYPGYYDAVTGLSERVFPNWIIFHNHFTKDNISLMLTPREYQMAFMAAQGDPYKKIAERFHISVGTLNNNMQTIYRKLFITGKKDLAKFIL